MTRIEEVIKIVDRLSMRLFGMTIKEALDKEICIKCKLQAYRRIHSISGLTEYKISALCEECFDAMIE